MEFELFDQTGHLTQYCLIELMSGTLSIEERIKVSEHLSECDVCTKKYTDFLSEDTWITPPQSMAPVIEKAIKRKQYAWNVKQYSIMAVAAGFAIVILTTNLVFPYSHEVKKREERNASMKQFGTQCIEVSREFTEDISEGIQSILSQFNQKGERNNEKK